MFPNNNAGTVPVNHEAIPGYVAKEVLFSGCIKAGVGMFIFYAEHDRILFAGKSANGYPY